LELFARHKRPGWDQWGNEIVEGAVEFGAPNAKIVLPMAIPPNGQARLFEPRGEYEVKSEE
jgi:hypothetical protein